MIISLSSSFLLLRDELEALFHASVECTLRAFAVVETGAIHLVLNLECSVCIDFALVHNFASNVVHDETFLLS